EGLLRNLQDYLADVLVAFHAGVRIGGAGERENSIDHGFEVTSLEKRQRLTDEALSHQNLIRELSRAHHDTDELQLLPEQCGKVHLYLRPAEQTQYNQSAVVGEQRSEEHT